MNTPAATPALSSAERQILKGRAHGLNPVVFIGAEGLTPAVVKDIDRSLKAHELIKIRVSGTGREEREDWLRHMCEELQAHPVQHIGKILVVYRKNPEVEKIPITPARSKKKSDPRRSPKTAGTRKAVRRTGTSR
jgi:RNA-binding protein